MSASVPRPRVLVVEDDRFNARLLGDLCQSAGYEVQFAEDGLVALERLKGELPDAVLLDVMLPRLDGFGVLERIRTEPRTHGLPVVMVTAVQDQAARIRAIEAGVDDLVVKPFRLGDLRARLDGVIGARRFLAALQAG